MSSPRARLVILLSGLVVWGCSSAPVRYYTLLPPQELVLPEHDRAQPDVEVRVASIPAALNSRGLLIRHSPTEIVLLENEQWASPLRDEIKTALLSHLQQGIELKEHAAVSVKVVVDIERFEASPGRYASIAAYWSSSVSPRGGSELPSVTARCGFSVQTPIGLLYSDVVKGYQDDLRELAQVILKSLERADGREICPGDS